MSYGQGGPGGWVPGGSNTPDWNALAADAERRRGRRRTTVILVSALATVLVGAVVAFLIVSQSGDDGEPAASGGSSGLPDPSDSGSGEPSFEPTTLPPLPQPREFISDPEKDIAPFSAEEFFAGDTMEIEGRSYARAATQGTADCAEAASAELGAVLADNGCAALLRATYTGDGVVMTVGVAQFGTEDAAIAAREAATGNLLVLTGGDAPTFCQQGGCRTTTNQVGRYTYFTIAGNADGSPDSGEGTPAQLAARDGNDHAFARIIQRGEAQASASASALVEERESQQE
ncbi:hypothetical protein [Streptomyces sp. PT12]|uniref:hypothetical protein n=1 Tax=Streptomyces sp. PT12 TaxID=1510197 RepID=UPI000DE1B2C1|nr:hypothetical protein [Streptomyces sp. PT12]RBM06967.1 hypothetical protein DEH69_26300 [Streptomyces sp. PT12]